MVWHGLGMLKWRRSELLIVVLSIFIYWLVLKPPSREWVRVSLRLPKRRR